MGLLSLVSCHRYVRAEFRAHRQAKPEHLTSFFQEWEHYLQQLNVTARARESLATGSSSDGQGSEQVFAFGSDLDPQKHELSAEQLQQLEKLRQETEKLVK